MKEFLFLVGHMPWEKNYSHEDVHDDDDEWVSRRTTSCASLGTGGKAFRRDFDSMTTEYFLSWILVLNNMESI